MKLQSGREVSNDLMNTLAESATFAAFGCEDTKEGMDSTAESLENGGYEGGEGLTEVEVAEILTKIEPLVSEAYGKLHEFYDKLVKEHLTKSDWEVTINMVHIEITRWCVSPD